MVTRRYGFKKAERLTRKKLISHLFDKDVYEGVVKSYPFMLTWRRETLQVPYPAQAVFVASKKFSRKASERARIKRQMREIYRYRKPELYKFLEDRNCQIILALIFTGKKSMDFHTLNRKLNQLIDRLEADIDQRIG